MTRQDPHGGPRLGLRDLWGLLWTAAQERRAAEAYSEVLAQALEARSNQATAQSKTAVAQALEGVMARYPSAAGASLAAFELGAHARASVVVRTRSRRRARPSCFPHQAQYNSGDGYERGIDESEQSLRHRRRCCLAAPWLLFQFRQLLAYQQQACVFVLKLPPQPGSDRLT